MHIELCNTLKFERKFIRLIVTVLITLSDKINGTLMWYYSVCKREVWLMSRNLTPDQEDENILKGKLTQEEHFKRSAKEHAVGDVRVDMISYKNGGLIVSEIKKSSRYLEAATLQLKYYLYTMEKEGVDATGELRIPEERKIVPVSLGGNDVQEIEHVIGEIKRIISSKRPPEAVKIRFCGKCAYSEFCWS
jgi:CRISPR-associated exonuclease Cas4